MDRASPILLEINSVHPTEDGLELMRMQVSGRLRKTREGWVIQYVETSCEPGEEPVSDQVLLTLLPGQVRMTRMGDFGATMVFDRRHPYTGQYTTPYGGLAMQVVTSDVWWQATPESGKIHLSYELTLQGQHAGPHRMDILYRRAEA